MLKEQSSKTAFVSGRYHRGQFTAHDSKGNVVRMDSSIAPVHASVTPMPKQYKEIRIEPWIRKAIDSQNAIQQTVSCYTSKQA